MTRHPTTASLYYSGTVNPDPRRFTITLWSSQDDGTTWYMQRVVATGRTA
jgi:hypothetical protein